MFTSPARILLLVAVLVLVAGAVCVPLFPQPVITFSCSTDVCVQQTAGGIAIGYVLLVLGALIAGVAGIISLAARAGRH